jgi:hypothetical protein
MTANIAFALSAAVLSLFVVVGAALLVAGFLARAAYGRRRAEPAEPAKGPEHEPERKLRHARFRRR